ncbi:MAG: DUF1599 domain-containing protein [Patescibacteria group bacterium]|nr:DUF1599 domain-containing protein [Patescibacteria group bacterium]
MIQQEFLKHFKKTLDDNFAIVEKKNADYSTDNEAFLNFKACEAFNIPVETGLIVRMCDKMSRISNLMNKEAAVKDESVLDTLQDLANYATILKVYLEHEKKK